MVTEESTESVARRISKDRILTTFRDLLSDFFYYDRKEDGDLCVGDIERAVRHDPTLLEDMIEMLKMATEKEE